MKHPLLFGLLLAAALVAGTIAPAALPTDPHATINAAAVVQPAPDFATDTPDAFDIVRQDPAIAERAHQLESLTPYLYRDPVEEPFDLRFIDPVLRVEPAVWRSNAPPAASRPSGPETWRLRPIDVRPCLVI